LMRQIEDWSGRIPSSTRDPSNVRPKPGGHGLVDGGHRV